MSKRTVTYSTNRLQSLRQDLEILRCCPNLPMKAAVGLNRIMKKISTILDAVQEEIAAVRSKHVQPLKDRQKDIPENKLQWTPEEEQAMYAAINEVANRKISIEIEAVSSNDFPNDPDIFGTRKFLKQDVTNKIFEGETHYFDHYLNLLGDLIVDEDNDA